MLNFFRKKSNPKITFFTEFEGLKESSPVEPAIKYIPEWFRKVPPNSSFTTGTIKKCPGFIDFMKRGFVTPLWCDLYLNVQRTPEGIAYEWKTPDPDFMFEAHGNDQFLDHAPQYAKEKYLMVLKANSPWRALTEKGYSLYQLPMTYEYNENFDVLPGIIHSDLYHTINQQIAIKKEGEFVLKKGTPLCVYIPFKREEFDMVMTMEDDFLKNKRMVQLRSIKSKFTGRLNSYKKQNGWKENE